MAALAQTCMSECYKSGRSNDHESISSFLQCSYQILLTSAVAIEISVYPYLQSY